MKWWLDGPCTERCQAFGAQHFSLIGSCTITKRLSAKNSQRHSVVAGQLVLFFFDPSPMPLVFPTLTIKHFPLTQCRALLKENLV